MTPHRRPRDPHASTAPGDSVARLHPDDIEQIARRVAELLAPGAHEPRRLVDAATAARRLGVDRKWVYAHANQLGAVRLGGGRGRLRFDFDQLVERAETPVPPRVAQPRKRRAPARRPSPGRPAGRPWDLLPYHLESAHHAKRPGGAATPPGPTPGGLGPDAD